jgi:hypothetical protein
LEWHQHQLFQCTKFPPLVIPITLFSTHNTKQIKPQILHQD